MRGAEPNAIAYTFTKANGSPVTMADFVVQAFVASRLGRHFPEDPVVAEEDASALRADAPSEVGDQVLRLVRQLLPGTGVEKEQLFAGIDRGRGVCGHRFWTLDPIDGTKGLLRGGCCARRGSRAKSPVAGRTNEPVQSLHDPLPPTMLLASNSEETLARMNGTIRRLARDKGFGFIAADRGAEYFFHRSACTDAAFDQLREGQSVSFDVGEGPKGPRAENVKSEG